jgi:hypothetical protein
MRQEIQCDQMEMLSDGVRPEEGLQRYETALGIISSSWSSKARAAYNGEKRSFV